MSSAAAGQEGNASETAWEVDLEGCGEGGSRGKNGGQQRRANPRDLLTGRDREERGHGDCGCKPAK